MSDSKRTVYIAVAADLGIAAAKFVAAGFTGSSSMLTEGIHSVIDAGIVALMLVGMSRSTRPADEGHPFGHARELYFWTTVVALLLFAVGGGASALEGIDRLIHPQAPESPGWNYGVLAVSAALGAYSFAVAYRQLRRSRPGQGVYEAIRTSKDPNQFSVLLIDSADLLGVAVALLGVLIGHLTGSPYPDAVATLAISLVLAATALVLANESRALLIGESADRAVVDGIRAIAEADPAVERAPRPFTMQLGPEEILLGLDIRFRPGLSADDVEEAVDRVERAIREKHPEVRHIFLEIDSLRGHHQEGAAR